MLQVVKVLACSIVVLSAIWLIALAVAAVVKPDKVKGFFAKFASSAFAHFLEMSLRLVVGVAFVVYATQMKFSVIFTAFGWLLILTTAVLIFVPWKVHRKFADKSLPMIYKLMPLFCLASLGGGVFILYSTIFRPI